MEDEDGILWTCVCRFCSSTTEINHVGELNTAHSHFNESRHDCVKMNSQTRSTITSSLAVTGEDFFSPFSACSMICLRAFFRLLALSISCSLDRYVLPSEPDSPPLSPGLELPLSWLGTEPAGTTWMWQEKKRKHDLAGIIHQYILVYAC